MATDHTIHGPHCGCAHPLDEEGKQHESLSSSVEREAQPGSASVAATQSGQDPVETVVRVLLIDDDRDEYLLTKELIEEIPNGKFLLEWTSEYSEGVDSICNGTHDVFLLDYRLGLKTGIELLKEAHERGCAGPVIMLTGQVQSRTDLEALEAGADDYLEKNGLTVPILERAIRYALRQHRYERELERKVWERTQELAKLNEALREADRRKDEFLSTLAHELRNPLAPLRHAIEIIRLGQNNTAIVERNLSVLERQISVLVRLIDDLVDVARISTGKLRLSRERVPLQRVIEAAVEISKPLIEKSKLTLSIHNSANSIFVFGDEIRLSQIFANLLNNAAKYTLPGGKVTIEVEIQGRNARVKIRDTGVGIPPEELPHIFELFTQVNRTLNRSQGGLGIGLAIVHKLVTMHEGRITVNSDNSGTEFITELPLNS